VDEVFSPQQVILDEEILSYVGRVVGGFSREPEPAVQIAELINSAICTGPRDILSLISEGVREGGFAGLESTARRFRGLCSFPELFRHWNVARWKSEGAPPVLHLAWRRAEEQIASSDYQLPRAQAGAVDRVWREAAARFGGSPVTRSRGWD
jgi:hypothetical protein